MKIVRTSRGRQRRAASIVDHCNTTKFTSTRPGNHPKPNHPKPITFLSPKKYCVSYGNLIDEHKDTMFQFILLTFLLR
ncbi:hypothetical protein Bpfe_028583 [Biomphalaria pfeifferi]|uniref:Uncharacterized protein n=1 Tax=Biomphalaria pfeifferi TaxID=112525 RepID=A0AAD8AT42_BIOPF|nr:hypothetical protein Bpfe_028583 [Biomphalaria pfeifferi]